MKICFRAVSNTHEKKIFEKFNLCAVIVFSDLRREFVGDWKKTDWRKADETILRRRHQLEKRRGRGHDRPRDTKNL